MALNWAIGLSQEFLETELGKARADLLAGKTVSRATVPGIDVTNQLDMTPRARVAMILKALSALDPTTYPPDQTSPSSSTRIIFNTTPTTDAQ